MSLRLRRKWQPHPAQKTVMEDDHRFRIVAAGRRFGKTEMTRRIVIDEAWVSPNADVWWVGPTYTSVREYGFEPMLREIPPAARASVRKQPPFAITLINDATISFRSADREDGLRGAGLDIVVLDEAASVPSRAWQNELRPTLSDTLGRMVAIGTPKGQQGWFYEWFNRGQDDEFPDVASWQYTTYDNPIIEQAEIESARSELPQFAFEQEYLARFTRPSGLVYQNFDDANLTTEDPPNAGRVIYGVDWGFNSPAAIVALIETRTDEWYAVDEVYEQRQTADDLAQHAERLQDLWGQGTFFCDPAEPDSIEEFVRHGLDAVPGDNDVLPGIQTVTSIIPSLKVNVRCENLIRELNNYRYPEDDEGDNPAERPIEVNDHSCDALRYAIHTGSRHVPNIGVVSGDDLW